MIQVLAPCPGRLLPITEVDDPVFAQEMVGPGVAIDPDPGETTVVSPIAGKVVKIHPHAFVVLGDDGVGVLVHLGINTVRLEGKGFEVLASQGDTVTVGTPMVRWDPSAITDEKCRASYRSSRWTSRRGRCRTRRSRPSRQGTCCSRSAPADARCAS